MDKSTIAKLNSMNACSEAVDWLQTKLTFEQAWADCERGDWMLWLLGKLSGALPDCAGVAMTTIRTPIYFISTSLSAGSLCVLFARDNSRVMPYTPGLLSAHRLFVSLLKETNDRKWTLEPGITGGCFAWPKENQE